MPEYQSRMDRQTLYFTFLVVAAVLLWEALPLARAWITPYIFAILCAPLWLDLARADTPPPARRAYLTLALRGSLLALALRGSLLALAAALLLILQGAR